MTRVVHVRRAGAYKQRGRDNPLAKHSQAVLDKLPKMFVVQGTGETGASAAEGAASGAQPPKPFPLSSHPPACLLCLLLEISLLFFCCRSW